MEDMFNLERFRKAHNRDFEKAFSEIKSGKKTSHWMWYIFPNIRGLGRSDMSDYYGIKSLDEAKAFLADADLCHNLIRISQALLELETDSAEQVFGYIDALKLRSCMTLFSMVDGCDEVFVKVLDKFFDGRADGITLTILGL